MKKILVPIDFTPASRAAAEYAAYLALALGSEVYLFHAYMEAAPAGDLPVAWEINELQQNYGGLVQKEIDRLKDKFPIKARGSARMGFKQLAIGDMVKEIQSDLVVMGCKAEKCKVLGSATFATIRRSDVPVLVIPEGVTFTPIRHIVLATDLEQITNDHCFSPLFQIAGGFGAHLQVIHVHPKGEAGAALEAPGKVQLGRVLSKIPFEYQELEDKNVEHGILAYIQNHPAELLVMLAHRHSFLERIFGHIHTSALSRASRIPVLVLEGQ